MSPSIWRWIFLATRVGPVAAPVLSYGMIIFGLSLLALLFVKTYKKFVFTQRSEIYEIGRDTLRRGSTLIINSSHKIMPSRDYQQLNRGVESNANIFREIKLTEYVIDSSQKNVNSELPRSDSFRNEYMNDSETETESLINSDNSFIISEHNKCNFVFKLQNDVM